MTRTDTTLLALGALAIGVDVMSACGVGSRTPFALACRYQDDRSACCALGYALTGEPDADADYVALLRHACVALDPTPGDAVGSECACAVLLDAAASTGRSRDTLYAELESARCARTEEGACRRRRAMPELPDPSWPRIGPPRCGVPWFHPRGP